MKDETNYIPTSNNNGWVCPRCGKVFAPTVNECFYCNDDWGSPWTPNPYPLTPVSPWYTTNCCNNSQKDK